ncbi:GAF domain-containing protein [Altererythrobacter fulvus]|uniref:GAF domain-containing protein n=1 Tax=Caenibius fulvus TaxID=2126012 RepID=UPI003017E716
MSRSALEQKIERLKEALSSDLPAAMHAKLSRLLAEAEAEQTQAMLAALPADQSFADTNGDLLAIADHAVIEAMRLLGAQFGSLQLYDPETETLQIVAQRNFREPQLEYFAVVRPNDNLACSRCVTERRRVIIEDVAEEPSYRPHLEVAERAGIRAVQSTPLQDSSGRLLAVLSTLFTAPRSFTQSECDALDLHAGWTTSALARHLYG